MWSFRGQKRPDFAIEAGPGQESVWDYPRPPAVVADTRRVVVRAGGEVLAESTQTIRVLETASPPTFYIPAADVRRDLLNQNNRVTGCEWKGPALYFDYGDIQSIAWSYPDPRPAFRQIAGHFSFYANRAQCFVDAERAVPQAGSFYGGWVTSEVVGPFKGDPQTLGW